MSSLKELFGIDKLIKFKEIVKNAGGIRGALKQSYVQSSLRQGTLVGEDKFGNKYFEDNSYFMPRNRWVQYNEKVWLDFDASQVPPEWHRWLHHITDKTPIVEPPVEHKWIMKHAENVSLYSGEKYVPYSTTRPKVTGWQPGEKKQDV